MEKDCKYFGRYFSGLIYHSVDIHTLLKPENILPTGPWLMHIVLKKYICAYAIGSLQNMTKLKTKIAGNLFEGSTDTS
jgi:hypothetical protein